MIGRSRPSLRPRPTWPAPRAAVEDYLTTISESRLLKSPLPGLQPLRQELLATALKYYEDFVSRNQDDPGLRAELAAAQFRVGEITELIGSKEEALEAFQTALGIYESLANATPSTLTRSYRAGQARCLLRMAMIQAEHGQAGQVATARSNVPSPCWISSTATNPGTRESAQTWHSPTTIWPARS